MIMSEFLDKEGSEFLWNKTKALVDNKTKWRRITGDVESDIHLIGKFVPGTSQNDRYVWINGTKYNLNEEFDFSLDGIVWITGPKEASGVAWFGPGLQALTRARGLEEVENASDMFYNCSKLEDISGLANWDTTNLKNIFEMFRGCSILSDLTPLAKWKTPNLENMDSLFRVCVGITDISPIANWDVSHVTTLHYTFRGCKGIESIDCLKQWTPSSVTTLEETFYDCDALVDVDLSGWNIKSVEGCKRMFYGCDNLKTVILDNANVNRLGGESVEEMYNSCPNLTLVSMKGLEGVREKDWNGMFNTGVEGNVTVDVSNWDTFKPASLNYKFNNGIGIKDIIGLDTFNTEGCIEAVGTFTLCRNIKELDLTSWNFESINSLTSFLRYCTSLTTLKFGVADFASVTTFSNCFQQVWNLKDVTGEIKNIRQSINLGECPLTAESAMVFINGLSDEVSGKTITLKTSVYNRLSPEQIAVATEKGWNVAQV